MGSAHKEGEAWACRVQDGVTDAQLEKKGERGAHKFIRGVEGTQLGGQKKEGACGIGDGLRGDGLQ